MSKNKSLIFTTGKIRWDSCKTISANLYASYNLLYPKKIDNAEMEQEVSKVHSIIERSDADHLVFLDHQPHPYAVLRGLSKNSLKKFKKIVFHVYGDFTIFTPSWLKLEEKLKNLPVHFVTASPKQTNLMKSFCLNNVHTGFFPVSEIYRFKPTNRRQLAARFGIDQNRNWILYTGRLSSQKNVLRLAKEVIEFQRRSGVLVHLILLGNYDDIGAPFFGMHGYQNEQALVWAKYLNQLAPEERATIKHLGHQEPEILHDFYTSADLFASLSTYHDEDYGMSPIEALCSGCPALLSDWGGFGGFLLNSEYSNSVAVSFSERFGLVMDSAEIQNGLRKMLLGQTDRQQLSKFYSDRFSIEAGRVRLGEILQSDNGSFKGFSKLLRDHADMFSADRGFVFKGWPRNKMYSKFYRHYYEREV